ncbi:hypothetical protein FHS55_001564 [Angulomicrobium tetraedrale]|uniref:Uncharacterized protein n=1 Tax=Ancylobacter tetraedralis TaxID=217068 RepID=A0A839Z5M4_9HYPH|nr:hypothetical protein [Ancylobacter tetraedralis]MBB3770969.1 hypothetical protein [Ancylobacter tetraedralis]
MVDLRVFEGGGSDDDESRGAGAEVSAALAFERLVIEILRAAARGSESTHRVADALMALYEVLAVDGVRLRAPIHAGLGAVSARLTPNDEPYDAELRWLLQGALRLTAEKLATDGFARGRASQRQDDFDRAFESYLLDRETTARKWGGSYLMKMLKELPPLAPQTPPRKPRTKSKASKKAT